MDKIYSAPRRSSRGATKAYQLRVQAGLTQKELAARAHVSLSQVQGLERDDSIPRATALQRIAEVLGVQNPMELIQPRGAEPERRGPSEPTEEERVRSKKFKGIHWDRTNNAWVVTLHPEGVRTRYGSSRNLDEAIKIWEAAKKQINGGG